MAVEPTNLIKNGTFSNGKTDWAELNVDSFTVVNGQAIIVASSNELITLLVKVYWVKGFNWTV